MSLPSCSLMWKLYLSSCLYCMQYSYNNHKNGPERHFYDHMPFNCLTGHIQNIHCPCLTQHTFSNIVLSTKEFLEPVHLFDIADNSRMTDSQINDSESDLWVRHHQHLQWMSDLRSLIQEYLVSLNHSVQHPPPRPF